ncbi:MAG: hypothetical protein AAFN93_28105, partial [Bacteroidota bacterium]
MALHLFPDDDDPKVTLRYATSILLKAVKVYISTTLRVDTSDAIGQNIWLGEYYLQHHCQRNQKKLLKTVQEQIDTSTTYDEYTSYWNFRFQESLLKKNKSKRKPQEALQTSLANLENFYLENKLRLFVESLNRNRITGGDLPISMISEIEEDLNQIRKPTTVGITIYHLLYRMFTEISSEPFFYEVDLHIKELKGVLSPSYLRAVYEYLMNQCIHYLNQGQEEFIPYYLGYIQVFIENRWFEREESISPQKMLNIVTLGVRANQISWTESFVKQFIKSLPKDIQPSFVGLKTAMIYFSQKRFSESLKALNVPDFKDQFFRICVEKLLIKIYFEQGDYEGLQSRADSFRAYIRRENKLDARKRQALLTFITQALAIFKYQGFDSV